MGQFKICQLVLNALFLLQIYVCVVMLQHLTLSQDNSYFKQMVSQIYPIELQFNKANTFDTEALFSN